MLPVKQNEDTERIKWLIEYFTSDEPLSIIDDGNWPCGELSEAEKKFADELVEDTFVE